MLLTLNNDQLRVELDARFPLVTRYWPAHAATPFGAADAQQTGVLVVNGAPVSWDEWAIEIESNAAGVTYQLAHAAQGWRLEWQFRLDGAALHTRLEVAGDPQQSLNTLGFEQLPLLVCPDREFTCWREMWMQAHWDGVRHRWPEPSVGIYACRGPEHRPIASAIPDSCARETLHACCFRDDLCAFVHTNYPHLPLLTQVLPGQPNLQRGESFSIGPNLYQYRVRDKTMAPLEASVHFIRDLNGDGVCDECDYSLWLNRQFAAPDPFYDGMLWNKIINANGDNITTFAQTLEIIEAVANVTDGAPQTAYLVGWQYDGHDTGFPSHDKINPVVGTLEELKALGKNARERFNCTVSYHANLDDAYPNSPDWDEALLCYEPNGEIRVGDVFDGKQSYNLNHTKNVESGAVFRRMQAMMELVPLEKTIHLDAFRYSNFSWEPNGDFIGPLEELKCGVEPILAWFNERGIDVTMESAANWPMDCPGLMNVVWHLDFEWKAQLYHGKMLGGGRYDALRGWGMGSAFNVDLDYRRLQNDWNGILDSLFLGWTLYQFYLQREMVELRRTDTTVYLRFGDGTQTCINGAASDLKVTQGELLISDNNTRFVPLGKAIFLYSRDGDARSWRLPAQWQGVPLEVVGLSRNGREPPPPYRVEGNAIFIELAPRAPVKISLQSSTE